MDEFVFEFVVFVVQNLVKIKVSFFVNTPFYLLNPVKLIVALAVVPGFFSKNQSFICLGKEICHQIYLSLQH